LYVDKSNACDVEKVKPEPEDVQVKEFKEDKKALVPSRLRLDHSMLYCLLKLIIFKGKIWTKSGSVVTVTFGENPNLSFNVFFFQSI
jgi:hypothetical protein